MYDSSRLKLVCNFVLLVAISLNISACATGSVKKTIGYPVNLERNERVALILHPWHNLYLHESSYWPIKEKHKIIECFKENLESKTENIRFVDIALSKGEYIGEDCKSCGVLTNDKTLDVGVIKCHPVYQKRILPLNIKVVVLLSLSYYRSSVSSGKWYEIVCGGSYGGVGCAGLNIWENKTKMRAIVVDLDKEKILGEFISQYESSSWLFAIGLPFIGSPDVSDTESCEHLGESVANFLKTND